MHLYQVIVFHHKHLRGFNQLELDCCISDNKVTLCSLVDKLCNGNTYDFFSFISNNAEIKQFIQHGCVCLCVCMHACVHWHSST